MGSPNFRKQVIGAVPLNGDSTSENPVAEEEPIIEIVTAQDSERELPVPPEIEGYRILLLHFFRDLSEVERLKVLIELGAFENDSEARVTQAIERQLFDWLVREGRIADIEKSIDKLKESKREDNT